ncbi:hypothetical protein MHBO_003043 [Bonamia ostreae]|uniref:TLDc domain-containing protein n=1 Tax=Bonamia ostreae TaxID=126728 RepID=A0ABV2AQ98_9EUKA
MRCDPFNFGLEDALKSKGVLKRMSLVKKEFLDRVNKSEKEKWVSLMEELGFELLKIDSVSATKKELVWINEKIRFGKARSFLFEKFDSEPNKTKKLLLNEQNEEQKLLKVQNYLKLSFNTHFFGSDQVRVYKKGESSFVLDKSVASWRLICAKSGKFPENVFSFSNLPNCENLCENEKKSCNATKIPKKQQISEPTKKFDPKNLVITRSSFKNDFRCGHSNYDKTSESFFCWREFQLITNDFQVLCGNQFKWQSVPNADIPDNAIIVGGGDMNKVTFPARVFKDDRFFVGEVCPGDIGDERENSALKCRFYNGMASFSSEFEVLVFEKD